jgi:hypothetical protein
MVVEQQASPEAGQGHAPEGACPAVGGGGEQYAGMRGDGAERGRAGLARSDSSSGSGEEEREETEVGGDGRFLPPQLDPAMLGVLDAFRLTRVARLTLQLVASVEV